MADIPIPSDQITQDDIAAARDLILRLAAIGTEDIDDAVALAFARHRLSASRQPEAGVRHGVIKDRLCELHKRVLLAIEARLYFEPTNADAETLLDAAVALCTLPAPQPRDDDAPKTISSREMRDRLLAGLQRPRQDDAGLRARLLSEAAAMRKAVSGERVGETHHADNWSDKPHRVLYDACSLIEEAAEALATPPARQDGPGVSEPAAYLKTWFTDEQHGCRVDLTEICEPWLDALKPTITPLYTRSTPTPDSPELRQAKHKLAMFVGTYKGDEFGDAADSTLIHQSANGCLLTLGDLRALLSPATDSPELERLSAAAREYAAENDADDWCQRLKYGQCSLRKCLVDAEGKAPTPPFSYDIATCSRFRLEQALSPAVPQEADDAE